MDRVAKRKKGKEQHPIPIKRPVSNKQPRLISPTRKIKKQNKQKGRYAHYTSTQCGPIFNEVYKGATLNFLSTNNGFVSGIRHIVKHGLDSICKTWIGFVKHGLDWTGFVKYVDL